MNIVIRKSVTADDAYEVRKAGEYMSGSYPQIGWFSRHKGSFLYRPVGPNPSLMMEEMEYITGYMRNELG